MKKVKERGFDTVVDVSVPGHGRDVKRARRVAEGAGINVICATGLYTYRDLPFYLWYRGPGTELGGDEPMVDMFLRDIEQGIGSNGIKAGIIKCTTDEFGVTPGIERLLRASAQVHRRTGVPITTHTHAASESGLEQQRIFREEGVDLGRVVIGHSGDSTDLDYLERLVDAGSYIGMDRFGIDIQLPTEERTATVAALCERGYADRMVLSQDFGVWMDWFGFPWDQVGQIQPNWHFTHVIDDVVPALRERGVSDEQIDQMLAGNPRAIFEAQDAY
jgi:phosphotriesterase-related protein